VTFSKSERIVLAAALAFTLVVAFAAGAPLLGILALASLVYLLVKT
jgi:hypothetical protein